MKKEKVNLLLIGNCSGVVSGSSLSFKRVHDNVILNNTINTIFINTFRKNNNLLNNFISSVTVIFNCLKYIYYVDVVSFNSDERAFKYFGPIIYLISRIFQKKIVSRVFGGSLDIHYSNLSFIAKYIFRKTIMKSNIVYLQTDLLINYFSFLKNSNIIKLPTSRSKNLTNVESNDVATNFIFTGRICKQKGIHDLINATKNLKKNIRIDLYGSLTEVGILDLINESKSVNYMGEIRHQNIYQTLIKYDVLILPTYWPGEGYPGSIIEAFHCGLPVISTNWRSIPEIVNQNNGIIIPVSSPKLIRNSILSIHNDTNLFESLKKGSKEASRNFDESIWIKKYIDSLISISNN